MNRFDSSKKPLAWFTALLLTAVMAGCGGNDPILGGGPIGNGSVVAPPVNAGILTPFGIASFGGITNVNSTIITKVNGDVVMDPNDFCNGVAVGTTNDFGPCNITGQPPTNNGIDKVVTKAWNGTIVDNATGDAVMAALLAKWNSISPTNLPGATVLGCGTIGSAGGGGALIGCAGNATLPPGVYISAASSTIDVSGTLTLNGGPTDVWVFQAPSALTTATNSRILLTGGARASNIWWFVGSAATLGTGSIFQGNVLASKDITMLALATSCGRLLSGAEGTGAFVFESNVVSVPGHLNAPPNADSTPCL